MLSVILIPTPIPRPGRALPLSASHHAHLIDYHIKLLIHGGHEPSQCLIRFVIGHQVDTLFIKRYP